MDFLRNVVEHFTGKPTEADVVEEHVKTKATGETVVVFDLNVLNRIFSDLGLLNIFPTTYTPNGDKPDFNKIRNSALSDEGLTLVEKIIRDRIRFLKNVLDIFTVDHKWVDVCDFIQSGIFYFVLLREVCIKLMNIGKVIDTIPIDASLSIEDRQMLMSLLYRMQNRLDAINNAYVISIYENVNDKVSGYKKMKDVFYQEQEDYELISRVIAFFNGTKYLRMNHKSKKVANIIAKSTHVHAGVPIGRVCHTDLIITLRYLTDPNWDGSVVNRSDNYLKGVHPIFYRTVKGTKANVD